MNTILERENILVIANYCNVLDDIKKYETDNIEQDYQVASQLIDEDSAGYMFCKRRKDTFNLTISEYYYVPDGKHYDERTFLFSKKKVRFFKKGLLYITTIYYYQPCT